MPPARQNAHTVDRPTLDSVADELYGLLPAEFTATRTAREKEARAGGDRDLANQIHALGKPTTVAWLANQLVREHDDEIGPLLELGEALREATEVLSGEDLRRLSQQQHQLVAALVRQARRGAAAAGQRVGEDAARGLEETLRAALADPELAEQLAGGRLTEGLRPSGFAPGAADQAPPTSRAKQPTKVAKPSSRSTARGTTGRTKADPDPEARERRRLAERLERAEAQASAAREAADAAGAARDEARARLDQAAAVNEAAADTVRRLRDELATATDEQAGADRERRTAQAAAEKAERVARDAERRLADVTARRDRLAEELAQSPG